MHWLGSYFSVWGRSLLNASSQSKWFPLYPVLPGSLAQLPTVLLANSPPRQLSYFWPPVLPSDHWTPPFALGSNPNPARAWHGLKEKAIKQKWDNAFGWISRVRVFGYSLSDYLNRSSCFRGKRKYLPRDFATSTFQQPHCGPY